VSDELWDPEPPDPEIVDEAVRRDNPDDYQPDPVLMAEFKEIQARLRQDQRQEKREREELERQYIFNAQQARRRMWIENGMDKRQPPEYRGHVFERVSKEGRHFEATPEMRADHDLTDEFIAFQNYQGQRVREEHPEYYCEECHERYATVVCPVPGCRSAKVIYPKEGNGNSYQCALCKMKFNAERVCGPCLAKRPEVQQRLVEEDREKVKRMESRKPKKTAGTTRGQLPYRPITEIYPD
jgi:hypothetical protein